jgi:hypothetical protein
LRLTSSILIESASTLLVLIQSILISLNKSVILISDI